MKKTVLTAITCLIFLFYAQSYGQAGTLDSSFGNSGKVTLSSGNANAEPITLQKDGKIVVVSTVNVPGKYYETHMVITRLNIDGSIDSLFGVNGKTETIFDTARSYYEFVGVRSTSVVMQSDNKIIAGGYVFHSGSGADQFAFARYLPNGNLDSSFGLNGKVTVPFLKDGLEREIYSVTVQNDGKIIGGGWADGYCVIRLNSNGSIDSSFGVNGLVKTPNINSYGPTTVQIQNDGKIVTGESSNKNWQNDTMYFEIDRMLPTGEFDNSFGDNGHVFTYFTQYNYLYSTRITHDGGIVAVGGSSGQVMLVKYKPNGSLDSTFGSNGYVITKLDQPGAFAEKILEQKDGKLIIIGQTSLHSMFITRFTANGLTDSTYGLNGKILIGTGATYFATSGAIQTDDKVIALNGAGITLVRLKTDEPILISIQKNVSISEGNTGNSSVLFKVVLNKPSERDVFVTYTTKDISALAGSDYAAASGTLKIKAGKTKANIVVNVIGDNIKEKNEKFALVLSNPVNALLGALDSATCTIKNDDLAFSLEASSSDNIVTQQSLRLYPNPVKDVLHITGLQTGLKTNISVTDVSGNILIIGSSTSGIYSLNIKHLPAGIYYIKIETNDSSQTLKFEKI